MCCVPTMGLTLLTTLKAHSESLPGTDHAIREDQHDQHEDEAQDERPALADVDGEGADCDDCFS